MPESVHDDGHWMCEALQLAKRGRGLVEPNPMVGCLIVGPTGQRVAAGYHERFGGPHAERNALQQACELGHAAELRQATLFVTLEPCCHHGKTPPCTDALLAAGLRRVVVAMLDPFEAVSGKGVEQLRAAGIQVDVGIEEQAARQLNAAYLKRVTTGYPWVIGKWAMSIDGKIATRTGDSQWISGAESRAEVHRLRSQVDAILVGSGTAVVDNPSLTARGSEPPSRKALRVVADSSLQLAIDSHLVQSARETPVLLWAGPQADPAVAQQLTECGVRVEICSQVDPQRRLDALLRFLVEQYNATNVLVEGGGKLLGGLLELGQLDQCEVFVGAKLIGGADAASPVAGLGCAKLAESPTIESMRFRQSGNDIHASYRIGWARRERS